MFIICLLLFLPLYLLIPTAIMHVRMSTVLLLSLLFLCLVFVALSDIYKMVGDPARIKEFVVFSYSGIIFIMLPAVVVRCGREIKRSRKSVAGKDGISPPIFQSIIALILATVGWVLFFAMDGVRLVYGN